MADETTPENSEAVETPPQEVINLDRTVRVGGEDIPVSELVKAREDLEFMRNDYSKLVQFRDATSKVMRQDIDSDVREQAAREVLVGMGYKGDQIEEYVSEWMQSQQQEQQGNQSMSKNDDSAEDNSAEQVANAIMQAQNQAEQTSQEMNRMKAEQLNSRMNAQIMMGLDYNKDAITMLSKLEEINGKEASFAAKTAFERDIREQSLNNLRARRSAAGTFEEAWVSEETAKATDQVLAKYRSVIGDPNKLGRAPETDSSTNAIFSRPAVQAPRWKSGMRPGDAETALDAYNKDALTRLAAGEDVGRDRV